MLLTNGHSPDYRVQKESLSLLEMGHSVTVLAWDRKKSLLKREFVGGTEIVRFGLISSYGKGIRQAFQFFLFYVWVFVYLITHDFDAVHCHDFDTLIIGFLAGKLRFKEVVYDAHEPVYYGSYKGWKSLISAFVNFLEHLLAKRVSHVIATNHWHLRKFQDIGVSGVVEVANYPPKDIFTYVQPKIETAPFTFGTVASLRPFIGIELMIDGFKLLRDQTSDVELIIAGPCQDNYLKELTEKAWDIGGIIFDIENNIGKMQERYEKLDVVLLLYCPENQNYHMNTSTRLYESMAARRAVIVSDAGFTAEITRRERCGVILEGYSPEALAIVMRQLYDDKDIVKEFAFRGYEAFQNRYYWEMNIESLKKIYPVKEE